MDDKPDDAGRRALFASHDNVTVVLASFHFPISKRLDLTSGLLHEVGTVS
jgi:hypothetical protein